MKIVDEKGKLFGLINVIDLLVLLIIFAVVAVVGYQYVSKKTTNSGNGSVQTITVDFKSAARSESSAKAIKPGDKIVSLTSYSGATVKSTRYEDALVNVETADGKLLNVRDKLRKDVYVTIAMSADLNAPIIKLGSQEIAVGKTITLKTPRVEFANAVVEAINIK